MAILRPVIHQKQILGSSDTVGQQIEEGLRLLIDPMQVFEDDDQRLVETFAQDDALDRIERATLAGSRFNLRNLTVLVTEAKQPVKVWQCRPLR